MSYVWVGVGLLAAGTTAQIVNQQQTARRQDNALAASLRQQGQDQQQANVATEQLLNKTAASTPDASQSKLLSGFKSALAANQGNATGGLNQVGNVSSAYTKAANDAAEGVTNYGNTTAGLLSAMEAPTVQRQNESALMTDFASQLGLIKQKSASDNFLAQMKLRGIQQDPWLNAAGSVASGLGGSLALGGMRGAGATTGSYGDGTGAIYGGYNLPYK